MSDIELSNVLSKLYEYLLLEEDWDSYGASRISYQAVKLADAIVRVIYYKHGILSYDIAPLPNGGVEVDYRSSDKRYKLEFDLGYPPSSDIRNIGFLYCNYTDKEPKYFEKSNISLAELFAWIEGVILEK